MRLIDAAEAMKYITDEYNRKRTGDGLRLAWIESAINRTPTFASTGVRSMWNVWYHGGTNISYSCNRCGQPAQEKTPYCPYCGAVMDTYSVVNGAPSRKNANSAPLKHEKCAETRKCEVQKCTKS